jgi:hypothetical protein
MIYIGKPHPPDPYERKPPDHRRDDEAWWFWMPLGIMLFGSLYYVIHHWLP